MGHVDGEIRVVRAGERTTGPPTPGMDRQEAFATEDLWAGFVRAEAGVASAWHHHGEFVTVFYAMNGLLRMESGPGGSRTVDVGPGDFAYVPAGLVHREVNPLPEPVELVVVRVGHGESTVNVEGPESA